MANTTNLNLVKPAGTDHALVSVINGNMDIIDSKVGAIPANESAQSQITALNNQIKYFQTDEMYESSASGWNEAVEACVDALPNDNKTHIAKVQRTGNGIVTVIAQKTGGADYASAIAFGYWFEPRYYSKAAGTWTSKTFTVT